MLPIGFDNLIRKMNFASSQIGNQYLSRLLHLYPEAYTSYNPNKKFKNSP